MPAALDDVPDRLRMLGALQMALQELPEAQHGIQRGAQLVAHPRQEVVLGLVRCLGSSDGVTQRRLDLAPRRHVANGRDDQ